MNKLAVDMTFVAAPFLPEHQPALGVSSLQSVLRKAGIASRVLYLNIEYAELIGHQLHRFITNGNPPHFLVGEMVFSSALWGDDENLWQGYQEKLTSEWSGSGFAEKGPKDLAELLRKIGELRKAAPVIVRRWAEQILAQGSRVVGFTTTFQQNAASLAVARELRQISEEVVILFGGANCEGEMGRALSRSFPFIDHVISGEGENVIVDIVSSSLGRNHRTMAERNYLVGTPVSKLDDLPTPTFDDYFDAVRGTEIGDRVNLAAESSRGCWWGMKSHCTFCGLNGQTMQFRSKSPARFIDELTELSTKYDNDYFVLADNIMDMKYVESLFPEMIVKDRRYKLFYEVKSNIRKDQLELMSAGGVARLQPGIESFSTPILKLMGKGTSRLQNIQLLKWCLEFKIQVAWNLLYGFPGEEPAEYHEMSKLIPLLVHLPKPTGSGRVRVDRFSPYWRSPIERGVGEIRHGWAYDFAYSGLDEIEREHVAYYFDRADPNLSMEIPYVTETIEKVLQWMRKENESVLELDYNGKALRIIDTRGLNAEKYYELNSLGCEILKNIDRYQSRANCLVMTRESQIFSIRPSEDDCNKMLDLFIERGWIVQENDEILSLVVDKRQFDRVIDRLAICKLDALGVSPEGRSRASGP